MKDPFTLRSIFKGEHLYSLVVAFILLGFAYLAEHFANLYELQYSLRPTSTHVGDLLLDNLPVINLNIIIIEAALLVIFFGTLYIIFRKPRYVLFSMKAVALIIATRALFVSLTHVGIYPGAINPGYGFFEGLYTYFNFQTGFFFSGHTAVPFLMALVFWKSPRHRYVFLAVSLTFAVAVLLAHIHYSIDVLAAPFMAFGIFHLAKHLFPKDYALIEARP